ncbi:hypothetical protein E4U03_01615 [Rothia nasimurium]|uniref:Uncharacterized protein n=1 Tax=Rothia nasimurium TaxID=85336 RepID=A0A4Y9F7G6_9MICC|nr:hypothetical protein [Rothia nasimurium]MBF0807316.1 hypothetical protein [Rothia nasimurium]TFU23831.1 hypothetical protein E4U03_01615 [Rothia nasimurium]
MPTPHKETPIGKHFNVEEIFDKAPVTGAQDLSLHLDEDKTTPQEKAVITWDRYTGNEYEECDPWDNQPANLTEEQHRLTTLIAVFKELGKSLFKVLAFATYTLAAGPFIIPPLFAAITGDPGYVESLSEQNIEIILMTMFYMACCYSAFAAVMCTRRIFKISRSSRVTESAPLGTASLGVSGKATEA